MSPAEAFVTLIKIESSEQCSFLYVNLHLV